MPNENSVEIHRPAASASNNHSRTHEDRFYVTGGTLQRDAPSYVERRADRELYEGLILGEFCYVLHARQMGKSSLMVHATARLRQEGAAVAAFELTALGQHLTVAQWYDGLLSRIGRELDLEDDLDEYWTSHDRLSPLQRFMGAIREVVLARIPGRIVFFLDEIDAVRSLPFSTDEFFAAIRECYNRRSQEPQWARLVFCLLGVATPSDLIQDMRTTPFNIGQRIELTDFTAAEAAPLAQGLGRDPESGQILLERVLHWTGGHPYLTQRLCQAMALDETVTDAGGVDRLCESLFLSPRAREQDDNLLFVRERLLKSEVDRASLLDLYGKVRAGRRVADDETSQLVGILRLSGITRTVEGHLRVRNRIYARAFDHHWIAEHMPDAELRRQRAAYQRGLVRATAVSGGILAIIGALARRADQQRRTAEQRQKALRRSLYAADMNVARQTWEDGYLGRAQDLLEAYRPQPGQEELRGFEWRHLWWLCQGESQVTLRAASEAVTALALSPDGSTLCTGSSDGTVTLWSFSTRRELVVLRSAGGEVHSLAFAPDEKRLAIGTERAVSMWEIAGRRQRAAFGSGDRRLGTVAFSPDGQTLAAISEDRIQFWDVVSGREKSAPVQHVGPFRVLAYSPDGKVLGFDGVDDTVRVWDPLSQSVTAVLRGQAGFVTAIVFSPDGSMLAASSTSSTVSLWDLASQQLIVTFEGHRDAVLTLAFSPDGKRLASGSRDQTAAVWEVATRQSVTTLRGHRSGLSGVAFSRDAETLITSSHDGTMRFWETTAREDRNVLRGHTVWVQAVAFSPDGKTLASASWGQGGGAAEEGSVKLWEVASGHERATLEAHQGGLWMVAWSPNGRLLATSGADGTVKLWNVESRQAFATLELRPGVPDARRGQDWALCVAFSPDGRTLAAGAGDGTARLWDVATQRPIVTLTGHAGGVRNLAFSPDGRILVLNVGDNSARFWSMTAGREEGAIVTDASSALALAFSPDGTTLATGSADGASLWDIASRREIAALKSYGGSISSVAFSPDGRTLATGGWDQTVRLWSIAARRQAALLKGHTGPVMCVRFSPDGNTLASSGGDKTVRLWRAAAFKETDR